MQRSPTAGKKSAPPSRRPGSPSPSPGSRSRGQKTPACGAGGAGWIPAGTAIHLGEAREKSSALGARRPVGRAPHPDQHASARTDRAGSPSRRCSVARTRFGRPSIGQGSDPVRRTIMGAVAKWERCGLQSRHEPIRLRSAPPHHGCRGPARSSTENARQERRQSPAAVYRTRMFASQANGAGSTPAGGTNPIGMTSRKRATRGRP